MKIRINDEFIVKTAYNYILIKEVEIKDEKSKNFGSTREEVIGCYSSLKNIVSSLVNQKVLDSDVEGVQKLVDLIEEFEKSIKLKIEDFEGECRNGNRKI